MNKKTICTASLPQGGGSYESPEVTVVVIHSEEVLCASALRNNSLSVNPWEGGDFEW